MTWEAYDYIIVCYDMIIKCKMSEKLLGKSETVVSTVDREYFGVTKVTWAKYSMSYNFINLACVRNLFNSGYFTT